jgi:hypothetical protein
VSENPLTHTQPTDLRLHPESVACAFVFLTNPHSFFLTLSSSLSLFSEHKHFPLARSGVAQKVKKPRQVLRAHASADSLLFF